MLHLALFCALPFVLPSFEYRVGLFSVNALPWRPLHSLGLPVTRYGWLITPNEMGWLWCFAVWVSIYLLIASTLTRLTHQSTRTR
jgi:hypothetical protein